MRFASGSTTPFFLFVNLFFLLFFQMITRGGRGIFSDVEQAFCLGKGSVGGGEAGKKAKTTPDEGGKSVSEKSQATRTCRNPFEKSKSKDTIFRP